jgi:adenine-specific DNA-methyltransferase
VDAHGVLGPAGEPARAFTSSIVVRDPQHAQANLVVLDDNERAMRQLAMSGSTSAVDLVYIDPPFATGRVFTGADGHSGYSDVWPSDAAFLMFLRTRLQLLRELMSEHGSLYLHLDTNVGYLARRLLDRTFGREHFRNEITRIKCNPKNSSRKAYGNQTDVIYLYSFPDAIWNDCREPVTQKQAAQYSKVDAEGRRYTTSPLHAPGTVSNGVTGQPWRGLMPPAGKHWACTPAKLDKLDAAGLIEWSGSRNPRRKIYLEDAQGSRIQNVWNFKDKGGTSDIYPTEKNVEMLERIVLQSSLSGSLVFDCFMGSGTTLVAAAKHGRRFVGIDQTPSSVAAAVHRLVDETEAAFTIMAADPIVLDTIETEWTLREEVDVVSATPPRSGRGRAAWTAMTAHRVGDVWHATPLAEQSATFHGPRGPLDTHALLFDPDGMVRAIPLDCSSVALDIAA